jgi:hypothetical protein
MPQAQRVLGFRGGLGRVAITRLCPGLVGSGRVYANDHAIVDGSNDT